MANDSNGSNVWKWIAALCITIMLAGAPAIYQAITAPSHEEVEFVRERQNVVLQRLAAIDIQIATNQAILQQLQLELREHIREDQSINPRR